MATVIVAHEQLQTGIEKVGLSAAGTVGRVEKRIRDDLRGGDVRVGSSSRIADHAWVGKLIDSMLVLELGVVLGVLEFWRELTPQITLRSPSRTLDWSGPRPLIKVPELRSIRQNKCIRPLPKLIALEKGQTKACHHQFCQLTERTCKTLDERT